DEKLLLERLWDAPAQIPADLISDEWDGTVVEVFTDELIVTIVDGMIAASDSLQWTERPDDDDIVTDWWAPSVRSPFDCSWTAGALTRALLDHYTANGILT